MLVYREGFGEWHMIDPTWDVPAEVKLTELVFEQGLFYLPDNNQQAINYNQPTTVYYLAPCYRFNDGVRLQGFRRIDNTFFKLAEHTSNSNGENFEFKGEVFTTDDIIPEDLALEIRKKKLIHLKQTGLKNNKSKTTQTISVNDNRIVFIKEQLRLLEQAAKAKVIEFDCQKLKCSKSMMLKWLQKKPGILFNGMAQSSFANLWKQIKDYQFCHHSHVESDFFTKIQG